MTTTPMLTTAPLGTTPYGGLDGPGGLIGGGGLGARPLTRQPASSIAPVALAC